MVAEELPAFAVVRPLGVQPVGAQLMVGAPWDADRGWAEPVGKREERTVLVLGRQAHKG